MDRPLCRQQLSRPRNGRTTCSNVAKHDGLCTLHANRARQAIQAVALQVTNNAIQEGIQQAVHVHHPPPPPRKIVKAKRPSQVKLCGEVFECQLCNEEKVPVEYNMELECGDKICHDCFSKLSDKKCPYCRVEMKSKKIRQIDLDKLETKSHQFKQEVEEETFQDMMRIEQEGMMRDPEGFFERVFALRIAANRDPNWIESPQINDGEDTACLMQMLDALCEGTVGDEREDNHNVHRQCHDLFPMYDCQYLYSLYNRASQIVNDLHF